MSANGFQFTIAGMAGGLLTSGFLPASLSKLKRLAPFYLFGAAGILLDDYRVRETCKVS